MLPLQRLTLTVQRSLAYLNVGDIDVDVFSLGRGNAYDLVLLPVYELAVLATVPNPLAARAPAPAVLAANLPQTDIRPTDIRKPTVGGGRFCVSTLVL